MLYGTHHRATALGVVQVPEQLPQVGDVRFGIEFERSSVGLRTYRQKQEKDKKDTIQGTKNSANWEGQP